MGGHKYILVFTLSCLFCSCFSSIASTEEMMEEIRAAMNHQWDALQHIRYHALLSKMSVRQLEERVRDLVNKANAKGGGLGPDETPKGGKQPQDVMGFAEAMEDLIQAYTRHLNASRGLKEESRAFMRDLNTMQEMLTKFKELATKGLNEAAAGSRVKVLRLDNVTADVDSMAVLSCPAPDHATVTWLRLDGKYGKVKPLNSTRHMQLYDKVYGAALLFITPVTHADQGTYQCRVMTAQDLVAQGKLVLHVTTHSEPLITTDNTRNVTAVAGSTVALNCRVNNKLASETVSWTYNGETYLTAGMFAMTSDPRVSVVQMEGNNWQLRIQEVRTQDSGPYVCQVSTIPPSTSTIWLNVKEPTSESEVASTPCLAPFVEIRPHVCVLVETLKKKSWPDALHYCRSLGGELAKDEDGYIRIHLEQQFGISGDTWTRWPFWLGGKEQQQSKGGKAWTWIDGTLVNKALWAVQEPRQYGRRLSLSGTCLALDGYKAYGAAALPCQRRRRFVCRLI